MKNTKALLLSAFCSIFTFSTLSTSAQEEVSATPVTVETATQQTTESSIEEVGKIKATDSAVLTFSAGEKLRALNFKDGDTVQKGQLIAQLDDSQAKAELDKAKSSLALAESKLDRVLALLKKQPDSMSAQDVEELKQQANLARAEFKQKKTDLKNYQLVAPFDGQLTNFTHSVGSRVEAATALVSLIKLDSVEVHYSISQSEVGQAQLGQKVSLSVDAYPQEQFTGTVEYIAPLVDENSGRVDVHAHFENSDHRLVPGMFAKVSQVLDDKNANLVVSQTSVGADGDTRFVWLVEGGKATKRTVTLGENTNNGYVAVIEGIALGDKVVITGQQNLQQGSAVNIQSEQNIETPAKSTEQTSQQGVNNEAA